MIDAAWLAPLLAAVFSGLLVGLYATVARRRGVLDHPGDRSSHTQPTPTGAGIGMVLALFAVALLVGFAPQPPRFGPTPYAASWAVVLGGMLALTLVGLWDDVRGVPIWLRFGIQTVAAMVVVVFFSPGNPWLFIPVVVLLIGCANAYNFMDGSNGLAGAQVVFCGALLAGLFAHAGQPGLTLAAASVFAVALGFLPWNAGRARVFMGDAGSVPLGFAVAALCYLGVRSGALPWAVAMTVPALFLVDAGLTLLGRVWRGERWYTPHRKHVYQRLISQGWSHGQVLLLYMALNLFVVAPVVATGSVRPEWALGGAILAYGVLAVAWWVTSLMLGERA